MLTVYYPKCKLNFEMTSLIHKAAKKCQPSKNPFKKSQRSELLRPIGYYGTNSEDNRKYNRRIPQVNFSIKKNSKTSKLTKLLLNLDPKLPHRDHHSLDSKPRRNNNKVDLKTLNMNNITDIQQKLDLKKQAIVKRGNLIRKINSNRKKNIVSKYINLSDVKSKKSDLRSNKNENKRKKVLSKIDNALDLALVRIVCNFQADIPKSSNYVDGPSLIDKRRQRMKNYQKEAEAKWKSYFNFIIETRWDNFEDFLYLCAQTSMATDLKLIENTNWSKVFQKVFKMIGTKCRNNTEIKELPDIPFTQNDLVYKGTIVTKDIFLEKFSEYYKI